VALRKLIQMNRARQIADLSRIHAKPAVKGLVCQGETSGEIPAHHQVSSPVHGRGKGCDGVDRRHTSDDSVAAVS